MSDDPPKLSAKHGDTFDVPVIARIDRGTLGVSTRVLAWGLSLAFHAGIFATSFFVSLPSSQQTKPELQLARGEHAAEIIILTTPWPDPIAESEEPVEEPPTKVDPVVRPEPPLENYVTAAQVNNNATDPPACKPTAPPEAQPENVPPAKVHESKPTPLAAPSPSPVKVVEQTDPVDVAVPLPKSDAPPPSPPVGKPTTPPLSPPRTKVVKAKPRVKIHRPVRKPSAPADAGVLTGVEILNLPRPRYPLVSRRRGEEGVVVLAVEVLPNGRSGRIKVVKGPGYRRLSDAAIAAVRHASFKPALRNGRPVRDIVNIPFRFVIE